MTVFPEKMPATPSPATALKVPVLADNVRCGHRKVGREWTDGTYRPPTKTALVGAAPQIKDPSSKRKMAAKKPHFAYAGSSESVTLDPRASRTCLLRRGGVE